DDFGQVCSVLEISLIVKVCLPVQGFGVGAAAVGSTISVYAIARLMMNLPAGILADRYGRKPLLVWGPLITAIGPGRYSVLAYRST
ncbi:MFS transporter, partial [Enterococcus faecium]|uniref:MFS transporter n=1 Tax=Enterococcus faecium TaxID=1352 RepID=UPI003F435D88